MRPKTIIATFGVLAAIIIGWLAGDPAAQGAEPEDLEVLTESAEVQVLVNDDLTYAEYEYTEPLPGTVTQRTYRGKRVNEDCEYSGSMSTSGTETRVWTQREISTDTETCVMVMEGSWVTEAQALALDETLADDPDYEHDGFIKAKTHLVGCCVQTWTKSRVRWSDPSYCITEWARTSAWWWKEPMPLGSQFERVDSWIVGSLSGCGTNGAWDLVTRSTFGEYEDELGCTYLPPPLPPPPGPDYSVTHWVKFEAKPLGASTVYWSMVEGGTSLPCRLIYTQSHTVDPS